MNSGSSITNATRITYVENIPEPHLPDTVPAASGHADGGQRHMKQGDGRYSAVRLLACQYHGSQIAPMGMNKTN